MTGVGNALCGKLPGLFFCVPMVAAIPVNRQSPSENSAADNRQSVDAQQCQKQQFPPPKTAADDKTGQKPGADVVGEAQKIGGFRSGQLLSFIQIRHRPGPQRIAAQEADENAGGPLRCGVEEPPQQRISHGADGGDEAAADQETGQQEKWQQGRDQHLEPEQKALRGARGSHRRKTDQQCKHGEKPHRRQRIFPCVVQKNVLHRHFFPLPGQY